MKEQWSLNKINHFNIALFDENICSIMRIEFWNDILEWNCILNDSSLNYVNEHRINKKLSFIHMGLALNR